MNTFKTVVMICAMLAASCSGQYLSHQSSNQGSPSGGMMAGQLPSYVVQPQQSSPALEQQRPVFTAEQSRPAASSLPVLSGDAASAPTTTQQICSCITINPAASASAAVHQQSAPASFSPADSSAQQPQQQSFAAPQQQTFAAPAQQQSFVAPAEQSYSTAPAAPHQQSSAQRPSSGY